MTEQRPFQVGDEVRWRWHEHDETGKWFKAKLTEQHPEDYPSGWAGKLTDRGTFYEGDESWDAPLDFVVYMDEPSMTLVKAAEVTP